MPSALRNSPTTPRTEPGGPVRALAERVSVRVSGHVAALDGRRWLAAVVVGACLSALAAAMRARLGTAAPPFTGRYGWVVGTASALAPAVAVAVVAATALRWHERASWRAVLLGGYVASAAWTFALALVEGGSGIARPLAAPNGYLPDVARIGDSPGGFLRHFVADAAHHTVATRQHPPGPPLLLWTLRAMGIDRPGLLGVVVVLIGAATVPLVAIAARSLCHELAARRLVPVLVLAPYALWVGVSLESVTATLAAAGIACGAVGSQPGRSRWWALAAGTLLGFASLFSYAAPWLGVSVIALYFVRRRPSLNWVSALGAVVPLALAQLAGFSWEAGLRVAEHDLSTRVGPARSWAVWVALDLVVLLVAAGPAVVASLRKARRTPGWPYLVGAALAVAFALASGLARGGVERSWVPFFPWLLVAAVAPERRPAPGSGPAAEAAPTPIWLVALGALAGVVLAAILRSPW